MKQQLFICIQQLLLLGKPWRHDKVGRTGMYFIVLLLSCNDVLLYVR